MTQESIRLAMFKGAHVSFPSQNSLHEHEFARLAHAFRPWLASWSFDRHESYDGDLTLILTSRDSVVSLVFSRTADGFHASILQADAYRLLGCYPTLDELVAAGCDFLLQNSKHVSPGGRSQPGSGIREVTEAV